MWERASREGVTMTHLGHNCFPLCPIAATQWVKNTRLDPRFGEENEQTLNYPGESANSIKSTTRKGASDIHLPLLHSNESLEQEPKSPLLKVEMGTGTGICIWSDAARNHSLPP